MSFIGLYRFLSSNQSPNFPSPPLIKSSPKCKFLKTSLFVSDSLKLDEIISAIFEKSPELDTQTKQNTSDRRKKSNSNVGYTAEPAQTTCAPTWLELVAKCKSSSNER